MKKQILNLGKALNKIEQKQINGGAAGSEGWCSETNSSENCDCDVNHPCDASYTCVPNNDPDEGSTGYGTCTA